MLFSQLLPLQLGIEYSHSLKRVKVALLRKAFSSYEVLSLKSFPLEDLKYVKQIYINFGPHQSYIKNLIITSDLNYSVTKAPPASLPIFQGVHYIKTWVNNCIKPYLHKNEKAHVSSFLSNCSPRIEGFTDKDKILELCKQDLDLISQPCGALNNFWKSYLGKEPCVLMLFDNDQAIVIDYNTTNNSYLALPFTLSSILSEGPNLIAKKLRYDEKKLEKIAEDARLFMSSICKKKPLVVVGDICRIPCLVQKWASLLGYNLSSRQAPLIASRLAIFPLSIGAALLSPWRQSSVEHALTPLMFVCRIYKLLSFLCYRLKNILLVALLLSLFILNTQLDVDRHKFEKASKTLRHRFPELPPLNLSKLSVKKVRELRLFYKKRAIANSYSNKFWADSILFLETALSSQAHRYQLEHLEMTPWSRSKSTEEIEFKLKLTGEASKIRDLIKKLYATDIRPIKLKGKAVWNNKGNSHDISFIVTKT